MRKHRTAISIFNEQGITSVLEVASESKEGGDDVYKRLYDKGELNTRVTVAMLHLGTMSDEENLKSLVARAGAFKGDENLDVPLVKFAIDGETYVLLDRNGTLFAGGGLNGPMIWPGLP